MKGGGGAQEGTPPPPVGWTLVEGGTNISNCYSSCERCNKGRIGAAGKCADCVGKCKKEHIGLCGVAANKGACLIQADQTAKNQELNCLTNLPA